MKKYICTALALLMAASLFVGCGCTNRNVSDQTDGMITDPTTMAPTTNPMPTMTTPADETTRPNRETTLPSSAATDPTGETDHTAATGSVTDSTDSTHSDDTRTRNRWPDRHS